MIFFPREHKTVCHPEKVDLLSICEREVILIFCRSENIKMQPEKKTLMHLDEEIPQLLQWYRSSRSWHVSN